MFVGYIYKFVNKINGKIYIGQTKRPKIRYKEHIYFKDKSSLLDRAINKYGVENFIYEILEKIENEDLSIVKQQMDELETNYIKEYNSLYPTGYNLISGPPKAFKKKISAEQRGEKTKRQQHNGGPGVPKGTNIGITRSLEEKVQISQKLKSKPKRNGKSNKGIKKPHYKVAQINIETNEVIEIFKNAIIAAKKVGCSQTNIRNVINGKQISASGFKWIKIQEDNI